MSSDQSQPASSGGYEYLDDILAYYHPTTNTVFGAANATMFKGNARSLANGTDPMAGIEYSGDRDDRVLLDAKLIFDHTLDSLDPDTWDRFKAGSDGSLANLASRFKTNMERVTNTGRQPRRLPPMSRPKYHLDFTASSQSTPMNAAGPLVPAWNSDGLSKMPGVSFKWSNNDRTTGKLDEVLISVPCTVSTIAKDVLTGETQRFFMTPQKTYWQSVVNKVFSKLASHCIADLYKLTKGELEEDEVRGRISRLSEVLFRREVQHNVGAGVGWDRNFDQQRHSTIPLTCTSDWKFDYVDGSPSLRAQATPLEGDRYCAEQEVDLFGRVA